VKGPIGSLTEISDEMCKISEELKFFNWPNLMKMKMDFSIENNLTTDV
jgi:hypothetical protein